LIDSQVIEIEDHNAMTQELSGRVAIVTGAGRNIGRAIALALGEAGAAIVVNARSNLKEAEAVAGDIERTGGKALAITADVAEADAVANMVAAVASRFGRIDILVNNAAVRVEQPLEMMTLAEWRAVTGVILDGAFNCVKACLPHLKRSGAGAVVNIGGLSAHTGAAHRAHVVAAKAGLVGFTRALAHELAPDKIRVNTVTPGLMATPRPPGQPVPQHHPLVRSLVGRRGEPSDIAAAVRFLCGPGASFITGQNVQVNGGTFLA
jgi:3-oxoacyl-[acyl-carrier protein] reductase